MENQRPHRRRGQASVFIALILFTLLIFVAMATNMGIVVNDKIRMQNTADLATYAVAYKEAQVLNKLTRINQDIADIVSQCRLTLVAVPFWANCNPQCGSYDPLAKVVIETCKAQIDMKILEFAQNAMYYTWWPSAAQSGTETANANFDGTGDGGHTYFMENEYGSPTSPTAYTVDFETNLLGISGSWPAIADLRQSTVVLNYLRMESCPATECAPGGFSWFINEDLHAWFYKDDAKPEVWVAGRVYGTPKKRFLDVDSGGGGYFGATSMGGDDNLYAYAVAKPYAGSVGPTQKPMDRDAPWVMAGYYMPSPAGYVLVDPRRDLAMVDEYRARMAGLQESLKGGMDPASLACMDAMRFGIACNPNYFEH